VGAARSARRQRGIGAPGSIATLAREDWDRVLAVNLTGPFLCAKHAFRAMQPHGGVILITASVAGLGGTPRLGAYGPSKAGAIQLMQTLALEGARFNIRANALCPVWTETPMVDTFVGAIRRAAGRRDARAPGIRHPARTPGLPGRRRQRCRLPRLGRGGHSSAASPSRSTARTGRADPLTIWHNKSGGRGCSPARRSVCLTPPL
jgi:NAD(P)-dependent dehydrogenase (short-subunit alcohol dehydrogenase family)